MQMKKITLATLILAVCLPTQINAKPRCNREKQPISYCDTSAGRLVLKSGEYSKYYCRNTAIMDLQHVSGCCTWHGGVLLIRMGKVVCSDGSVSPICSIQEEMKKAENYEQSDDSVNISRSQFLN